MRWTKKQLCSVLAAAVSICFLISLLSTVRVAVATVQNGGAIPAGMVTLTLVTAFCTFIIWRGVREMD